MRTLTKNEWIAVVVALVIVIMFLGSRFLTQFTNAPITDQLGTTNSATANTNNMDQNTNTSPAVGQLIVKDVVVGTGAEAKAGNLVSVQYTGKFANGTVFDSSNRPSETGALVETPIQFVLGTGRVIKGWDQGILGMKVGGKRSLVIPADLGYGAAGFPPVIPANATLYFDVELVGVQVQ